MSAAQHNSEAKRIREAAKTMRERGVKAVADRYDLLAENQEIAAKKKDSQPKAEANLAPQGKEVSRDIGAAKEGRSEANAKQTAKDLAKKNPDINYTVEADDTLKNGFVVVGRETTKTDSIKFSKIDDNTDKYGQYSEQSTAADPRQIERLNRSGVAGIQFGNVPSFVSRPINSYLLDGRIFGELATALGIRIAGFATNPVLTTEQRAKVRKFNGVFVDGTINIREGTDRPNLAVLGHEFGHLLRKNNPSLYGDLIKAIQPYVDQKNMLALKTNQ